MIDFLEYRNFFTNPRSQSVVHNGAAEGENVLDLMNEFPSVILSSVAIKSSESFPFRVSINNLDRLDYQRRLIKVCFPVQE